jgi:DNA polymerase I-like protein with 3'-5' exonuclease and polymerase domains
LDQERDVSYEQYLPKHVLRPDPTLYIQGTPLFLDFETTNHSRGSALDPRNKLVLAVWQQGWTGNLCSSWESEYNQQPLLDAIAASDYIVAHNAKFELQWLARCGLDLENVIVYDTMIADYVIGGNRWMLHQLGLDRCLERHGLPQKEGIVSKMIKAEICPSEIPEEWLLRYALQDVRVLPLLLEAQLADMEDTRLLPVLYNRCLLTPVLADLETQGMQLDTDLVHTKYKEAKEAHDELEVKMNLMTGGINTNSGPQLAVYLYETLGFEELRVRKGREWVDKRTPTGRRATDVDTIMTLTAKTKAQQAFKELYIAKNAVHTQLSKYLDKFNKCCDDADGVLYANFNQTNTQTHRLSSTGRKYSAQFQNFPRALKSIFCAAGDGRVVGEADGAQLEFRVAAHLGRCVAALADIEADVDVHTYTASVLTQEGQYTERQEAKEHTFKPLYGGQSGTEAEQAYYRAFREKYPGIAETQREWISYVLEHKYLETEWGLRYYWPDTRMDRSGYITNTTSISNYPVQAFATAEIIPAALVLMWHVIKRMDVDIRLINTVHDSIIADLAEGAVKDFHAIARWALIDGVYGFIEKLYGIKLLCRLGCGIKVASHWGGTKEETKYEADSALYKEVA